MNPILAFALTALLLTPATPVSHAMDGVVRVAAPAGTGSGFPVSEDEIMTAAHVIGGARSVEVRIDGRRIDGEVVRVDSERDIALVRISGAGEPLGGITLAGELPAPGQAIYAIGYPLGDAQASVSRGIVSAVRDETNGTHLQTDAAVNPGVSGGPVVSEEGEVLGMVVSKLDGAEGIGLAISVDEIRDFLADEDGQLPPATPLGSSRGLSWLWITALVPILALGVLIRRRPKSEHDIRITLGEVRDREPTN